MCAQNHWRGLGPIQTCRSSAKDLVLNAQNHRWRLGLIETSNSGPYHAVLHAKTTDDGWEPQRPVILILGTLLCMHKITGEVCGPIETCNFGPKAAVSNAQNHRWWLESIETSRSGANQTVLHAQNDRWCLPPIETCYSCPKVAHFPSKNQTWGQGQMETSNFGLNRGFSCTKRQVRSGTHRDL